MWLADKIGTMWEINARVGNEYPVLFSIHLVLLFGFALASIVAIARGQARTAFWCAVGAILCASFFAWGDDAFTHIYRTAALAEQVRTGGWSAFLTSPATGEAVPTFVYYSHVPYILPVALAVLGLPSLYAFKITVLAYFLVMAFGLQAMAERSQQSRPAGAPPSSDWLVALMFLGANYVYSLWFARASLAEIWVYCLMPWVVASALSSVTARWLAIVLFLQICGHPIVMAQCLVAEVFVAYSLSGLTPWQLVRRGLVPGIAAVVLSAAFWLPQGLWQNVILGPKALPASFAESFVSMLDLVKPHHQRTIGVFMPLAAILAIVVARARLSLQFWVPAVVGAIIILLQAKPFYPITRHIPTLDLSIFVWRLAFPAAFLMLGALTIGWREVPRNSRGLPVMAALTLLVMVFSMLQLPGGLVDQLTWQDDRVALNEFEKLDGVWGVTEYLPQYNKTPIECTTPDARRVSYRDLRNGVQARARYIRVPHGPVGLVDYEVNGTRVEPKACDQDVVLGPLEPTAQVAVSEQRMNRLSLIRAVSFVAALILMLAVIPFVRWGGERREAF